MRTDIPIKGWTLVNVSRDPEGGHCQHCGREITWLFHLQHADPTQPPLILGSECYKIYTFVGDADGAFTFRRRKWRPRRSYFWKRIKDYTLIMGQHPITGWWCAIANRVTDGRDGWHFLSGVWKSGEELNEWLIEQIACGKLKKPPYLIDRPTNFGAWA